MEVKIITDTKGYVTLGYVDSKIIENFENLSISMNQNTNTIKENKALENKAQLVSIPKLSIDTNNAKSQFKLNHSKPITNVEWYLNDNVLPVVSNTIVYEANTNFFKRDNIIRIKYDYKGSTYSWEYKFVYDLQSINEEETNTENFTNNVIYDMQIVAMNGVEIDAFDKKTLKFYIQLYKDSNQIPYDLKNIKWYLNDKEYINNQLIVELTYNQLKTYPTVSLKAVINDEVISATKEIVITNLNYDVPDTTKPNTNPNTEYDLQIIPSNGVIVDTSKKTPLEFTVALYKGSVNIPIDYSYATWYLGNEEMATANSTIELRYNQLKSISSIPLKVIFNEWTPISKEITIVNYNPKPPDGSNTGDESQNIELMIDSDELQFNALNNSSQQFPIILDESVIINVFLYDIDNNTKVEVDTYTYEIDGGESIQIPYIEWAINDVVVPNYSPDIRNFFIDISKLNEGMNSVTVTIPKNDIIYTKNIFVAKN